MNLHSALIKELAAHQIELDAQHSVVIHSPNGAAARFPDIAAALHYINETIKRNSLFLLNLWKEVGTFSDPLSVHPSNEITQRLFISAVKHLSKQAGNSRPLRGAGINKRLSTLLLRDISTFSQKAMSMLIDYRIAIDWISHLVSYDMYRIDLLKASQQKTASSNVLTKLSTGYSSATTGGSFGYSQDYDRPIPWAGVYEDSLRNNKPDHQSLGDSDLTDDQRYHGMEFPQDRLQDYDSVLQGLHLSPNKEYEALLPNALPREDAPQDEAANLRTFDEQGTEWSNLDENPAHNQGRLTPRGR